MIIFIILSYVTFICHNSYKLRPVQQRQFCQLTWVATGILLCNNLLAARKSVCQRLHICPKRCLPNSWASERVSREKSVSMPTVTAAKLSFCRWSDMQIFEVVFLHSSFFSVCWCFCTSCRKYYVKSELENNANRKEVSELLSFSPKNWYIANSRCAACQIYT